MDRHQKEIQILWGSPLPPTRSGVSDYAVELLPELARLVRVRVLRPPNWSIPSDWPASVEIVPADTRAEVGEILMVHLGNNPHHLWTLERLHSDRRLVVVLHDAVLHHLLVESTAALGDDEGLAEGLIDAHQNAGNALAAARRTGHRGRLDPFLFPARAPFLRDAAGVIVHSRWAEGLIGREHPGVKVGRVGLSVADPGTIDRAVVRSELGLGPDDLVIMHLGFLTPEKGLVEILTGVAAASSIDNRVRLVVVGEGEELSVLQSAAARLKLEDHLVVTGWIEPELFPHIPAAADLGIVLRTPSAGETSAAALRFFAAGVPVAVGGTRQFLEWPERAAPRLTPGPSASADLARLLSEVGTPDWAGRGETARTTYLEFHRPEQAARTMVEFLEEIDFGEMSPDCS